MDCHARYVRDMQTFRLQPSLTCVFEGYPYLPPSDFRDDGETVSSVMVPARQVITVSARSVPLSDLGKNMPCPFVRGMPFDIPLSQMRY